MLRQLCQALSTSRTKSYSAVTRLLHDKATIQRPVILGIETSCDDTGIGIVDGLGRVIGDAVSTQLLDHLRFGGIIPPKAADLHRMYIEKVFDTAMKEANLTGDDLDAIAVTNKPGLQLSLFVGLRYAKHLCRKFKKPMIPIHHMEAHALTARMEYDNVQFPFLCLLVSGGHCLLTFVESVDRFILLGNSIDDAPGEALDKVARRLKLRNIPEYSQMAGGRAIEVAASKADGSVVYEFPLPLARQRDCQFSFAGLKNSGYRHIRRESLELDIETDHVIPGHENFCDGYLKSIVRHITHRTQRAIHFVELEKMFGDCPRTLVIAGGVACNDVLFNAVKVLGEHFSYNVVRPSKKLCTDNGVMIAWNGVERYKQNLGLVTEADFDSVTAYGRYPLGEDWTAKVRSKEIQCNWVKNIFTKT